MNGALSPETSLSLLQNAQINQPAPLASKNIDRINEAAREFEAVFISEMIKPMFEGLETNEMFGGGKGEEIFRGMMLQEYGKEIAEKDITGIQTQVKNKLLEMQAERTTGNTAINAAPTTVPTAQIIDLEVIEK